MGTHQALLQLRHVDRHASNDDNTTVAHDGTILASAVVSTVR